MTTSEHLKKTFSEAVLHCSENHGEEIIGIRADKLKETIRVLKRELSYDILMDIIAVDWKDKQDKRFELDYLFYSTKGKSRVRLKVTLENNDSPQIETVSDLYGSANWAERECWDLMGIRFLGHPKLKRILLWENFDGHPLRKDYPINKRQPIPMTEEIL